MSNLYDTYCVDNADNVVFGHSVDITSRMKFGQGCGLFIMHWLHFKEHAGMKLFLIGK